MRFPHRDFKRDWNPGDSFCRCRSIKMGFYRHIGIDRVEFMLNKHVKRWVQFVDTVICVTNTTDYTEPSASDFAPKWFSHFWMTARMLPKQAHPGRLRRPCPASRARAASPPVGVAISMMYTSRLPNNLHIKITKWQSHKRHPRAREISKSTWSYVYFVLVATLQHFKAHKNYPKDILKMMVINALW